MANWFANKRRKKRKNNKKNSNKGNINFIDESLDKTSPKSPLGKAAKFGAKVINTLAIKPATSIIKGTAKVAAVGMFGKLVAENPELGFLSGKVRDQLGELIGIFKKRDAKEDKKFGGVEGGSSDKYAQSNNDVIKNIFAMSSKQFSLMSKILPEMNSKLGELAGIHTELRTLTSLTATIGNVTKKTRSDSRNYEKGLIIKDKEKRDAEEMEADKASTEKEGKAAADIKPKEEKKKSGGLLDSLKGAFGLSGIMDVLGKGAGVIGDIIGGVLTFGKTLGKLVTLLIGGELVTILTALSSLFVGMYAGFEGLQKAVDWVKDLAKKWHINLTPDADATPEAKSRGNAVNDWLQDKDVGQTENMERINKKRKEDGEPEITEEQYKNPKTIPLTSDTDKVKNIALAKKDNEKPAKPKGFFDTMLTGLDKSVDKLFDEDSTPDVSPITPVNNGGVTPVKNITMDNAVKSKQYNAQSMSNDAAQQAATISGAAKPIVVQAPSGGNSGGTTNNNTTVINNNSDLRQDFIKRRTESSLIP